MIFAQNFIIILSINLKIKGPLGFESRTSRSAVESALIKNVNKSHYPYFLITRWLQSGRQAEMGDEWSIHYKVYGFIGILIDSITNLFGESENQFWDSSRIT